MNVPEEEKQLLRACTGGDPKAWETFVDRYSPFLFSSIRKILAKRKGTFTGEEAETVYQEVFWELFREKGRALRAFSGRSKLTTYLWVIAYRKVLEHLTSRRSALPSGTASLEEVTEPASPQSDPTASAETLEMRKRVQDALATLPDRDRKVLSAFYFKGKSHREIAREIGLSPAAVGMIIFRGRKKLEKILKKT
ncbi:MAG: RNA polymerase sigma factor [Planctomycetota bacterium]|jgi:RNA polymerase sigma-70 factor (ECF subfamily)